jgi:hypothetical protein
MIKMKLFFSVFKVTLLQFYSKLRKANMLFFSMIVMSLVFSFQNASGDSAGIILGSVDGFFINPKNGDTMLSGWVCLQGNPNSINIQIFAGGPYSEGKRIKSKVVANKSSEAAVARACQAKGNAYRFAISVSEFIDQYRGKLIYVYGKSGKNTSLLAGSGKYIIPGPSGTWEAASASIFDPVVFQWKFYIDLYPDLKKAGINTESDARVHWEKQGIQECRRASPEFSVSQYLALNKDLLSAYGATGCEQGLNHYLNGGRFERRPKTYPFSLGLNFGAGDTVIGNEKITMRTSRLFAGAFTELWFRGKQYINSADTGRLLQVGFSYDDLGGCFGMTEAGGAVDRPGESTSLLEDMKVSNNASLFSKTKPTSWYKNGESNCADYGQTSDTSTITKNVTVGFEGDNQIIHWNTNIHLPNGHKVVQVEALTGYLERKFNTFYSYHPSDHKLYPIAPDVLTTGNGGGEWIRHMYSPVISTANGKYAMGIFAIDQEGAQAPDGFTRVGRYLDLYFNDTNVNDGPQGSTAKWSVLFERYLPPNATEVFVKAGNYDYDIYLVVGDLGEVRARMEKLQNRFSHQMLSLLAKDSKKIAFDADYYYKVNSDLGPSGKANDWEILLNHLLPLTPGSGGASEGRSSSSSLNPKYYLDHYTDLQKEFGSNNYTRAIKHFLESGSAEGRVGKSPK